jgi:hypothetical protein
MLDEPESKALREYLLMCHTMGWGANINNIIAAANYNSKVLTKQLQNNGQKHGSLENANSSEPSDQNH